MLNPELAIGWIFMALLNGEVAHTRGRSRLGWMGVSVILGPLGTVLLLVLPEGDAEA